MQEKKANHINVYFTLSLCDKIFYSLGRRHAPEGARVEEVARGAGLQSGQVVHADDVEVWLTLEDASRWRGPKTAIVRDIA